MSFRGALASATLLGSLAACATAPAPTAAPKPEASTTTADAPFRAAPPALESRPYLPPSIEETTLPNGMRLLVVERHGLPVAAAEVFTRVGTAASPKEDPLAFWLMTKSAVVTRGNQNAHELGVTMDAKLFELSLWSGVETTSFIVRGASSMFSDALRTLGDLVLAPAFPPAFIEGERQRHLAGVAKDLHAPSKIGARTLIACLYGDAHPYARYARASIGSAEGLSHDDVVRAWKDAFDPADTTLVVVGDVDPRAVRTQFAELFGGWKHDPTRPAARPIPPPPRTVPRLVVVDRARAPQAKVLFGTVVSPMGSPEQLTDLVLSALAGRMRSSAISAQLRAEAGIWGSGVHLSPHTAGGTLWWEGNTDSDKVSTTLASLGEQWRNLRERGPAPDELAAAKQLVVRVLPRNLETVSGLREAVVGIAFSGKPLDELANRRANVEAVDAERVRAEAPPLTSFTAVVVGDLAKLEAPLLGLGWGAIEVRDESGKYLRTIKPQGTPAKELGR
jgi:zinc protease